MASPTPYKGTEPYIFISYAHKDMAAVLTVVEQLQQDGFRVWYDEGISPGSEWDENIAAHLAECDFFIAFLSKNYLNSENCMDELAYARDLHKPQVLLYLERVRLPRGMELRIGRSPAFRVDKGGRFLRKLYATEGIHRCVPSLPKPRPTPWGRAIWAAPAVLLGAVLLLIFSPGKQALGGVLLIDRAGMTVTLQDVEVTDDGIVLIAEINNKTGTETAVFLGNLQINGIACGYSVQTAPKGLTTRAEFLFAQDSLDAAGLTGVLSAEDLHIIEGISYFEDYQTHTDFVYFPNGEEQGTLPPFTPDEDDFLLVDDNGVKLYLTDRFYDRSNNWVAEYVVVNDSEEQIQAEVSVDEVNGCLLESFSDVCYLRPDSWAQLRLPVGGWQDTDYNSVLQAGGRLKAYVWNGADVADSRYSFFCNDNPEERLVPRGLQAGDTVLLDNKYVQIAVIGTISNMDRASYRLYCRNVSDNPIYVEIYYHTDAPSKHYIHHADYDTGIQSIITASFLLSVEDKPEQIALDIVVQDSADRLLHTETVTFTPDW